MNSRMKDRVFICLMLILPILHFLIFWLFISFKSFTIAFQDEITGEWGFMNFRKFFKSFARDWKYSDGGLKYCIQNTLITAAISILIDMPLNIFASFVLFKRFFGHMFYRIIFYLPGIFGMVIIITMQIFVLDATGPIVKCAQHLGIPLSPIVLKSGLLNNNITGRATFFITSISISGGTILLLTGALQKIPQDLFDVGRLDGTGLFTEFWYLVLPCCWSTIGIMWIMTFSSVWGSYSRPMLLTNGAFRTNNFAYYLFATSVRATRGEESYNYPAAMGLLLTAVILPITLLLRWIAEKAVPKVEF